MKPRVVERRFAGETIVCLASGPSLTKEDVDFVRGKARVIAINATYKMAPWCDVLYAADAKVWRWIAEGKRALYADGPAFLREHDGLKYCLTSGCDVKGVAVLRRGTETGLNMNPGALNTGRNSGYQVINLAVHLGAKRIVLLGYDMRVGPKGQEHWHADHPNNSRSPYARFLAYFPTLVEPLRALGVEVINCSRQTALKCFPRMDLADVFSSREVAA